MQTGDDGAYDRLYHLLCGRLHPAIAAIFAHEELTTHRSPARPRQVLPA